MVTGNGHRWAIACAAAYFTLGASGCFERNRVLPSGDAGCAGDACVAITDSDPSSRVPDCGTEPCETADAAAAAADADVVYMSTGTERCNYRDDDCDGDIDEGMATGGPCVIGGFCGTFVCDEGGSPACLPTAGPMGFERCGPSRVETGMDGGPDPVSDGGPEAEMDGGPAPVSDGGPDVNMDGGPHASSDAGPDAGGKDGGCAPACDAGMPDSGADADAGGAPSCVAGASISCGKSDQGRCRYGRQACDITTGHYLACEGHVDPESEACDGLDGDCDGVDDAMDDDLAAVRRSEFCNGRDDDCDGQTDEGFAVGRACQAPGACGQGVWECDDAGGARCSSGSGGTMSRVSPEACDAALVDEDCDGTVNEGCDCWGAVELACGESNTGQCRLGRQICDPSTGKLSVCQGVVRAAPEACDGIDGDCDGNDDSTDPDLTPVRRAERCNGADDDCDGTADEGFYVNAGCYGLGACGAGRWECNGAGGATCSSAPGGSQDQSAQEACDGALADEDCDGAIDEGCACIESGFSPAPVADRAFEGGTHCNVVPGMERTTCDVVGDRLTMSVCQSCIDAPWSTCVFSQQADFSAFDGDGGSGVLEVSYCVDAVLQARVELWYGDHPWRKALLLHAPGEPAGCHTRYFEPSDACYSDFAGLPSTCHNRCGAAGSSCDPGFVSVDILLTISGCSARTEGSVELQSVTHLADDCRCVQSASCTDGVRDECRTAPNNAGIRVCAPADCAGRGQPCTSIVAGVPCNSTIECLAGQPVCPTNQCQ